MTVGWSGTLLRCAPEAPEDLHSGDAGAHQIDQASVGAIRVGAGGMAFVRFQYAEAVHRTAQRPGSLIRVVFAESVPRNDPIDDVDHFSDCGDEVGVWGSGVAVGDCVQPGVNADEVAPGVRECDDGIVAGESDGCGPKMLGELFPREEAELMSDVVDAVDVFIEG